MPETGETEEPEVTETKYVATTDGPGEDTETFYKRTPAPGQRLDHRQPPPAASVSSTTPDRLPLRRTRSEPDPEPASDRSMPSWLPTVALAVVAGSLGLVTLAVVLMYALGGGQTATDAPAAEEDEEQWEGLKVKKGLR